MTKSVNLYLASGVSEGVGFWVVNFTEEDNIFNSLKQVGLVDLLITASYFLFLTAIGFFMLYESLDSLGYFGHKKRSKYYHHSWIMGLPLKIRFRRSGLYISLIPPYIIGFIVGIFSSIMGVGGGFIIIPAMIYILSIFSPTAVAKKC